MVTLSVDGDQAAAAALLRGQRFVRGEEPLVAEADAIRVYVDQGRTAIPLIFRVLEGGGMGVRAISMSRPSLDDVFLRRTGRSLREEAA